MDKRSLLAIALIFVVFWLSNELIWKRKAPEAPVAREYSEVVRREETTREPIPERERLPAVTEIEPSAFDSEIEIEREILLTNERVTLHFTNLGAVLTEAYLKDYYLADKVRPINLIPDNESLLGITLLTDEAEIDLSKQVYDWEYTSIGGYRAVRFTLRKDDTEVVRKSYTLIDEYHVQIRLEVTGLGETNGYRVAFDSGIADTEESLKHKANDYKLITQVQGAVSSYTLRQLNRMGEPETVTGNVDWAAVRSKYFTKILIPDKQLQTSHLVTSVNNDSPAYNLTVRPGRYSSEIDDNYQMYIGPLSYDQLTAFGIGLEETMEMGWKAIRPLSRLFLWLLTSINKAIPNYGFTIVIFALILKFALYPLTHKSFKSMHKMQKMQPYMQEIQKKYKSDPKKMQAELGKLYKEHGTNPVGGCLPMLLQMPIFFALYPVLRYAVDLRQASFILWIKDLSEPDPLMILPIVMGLFMFVQQKISAPKAVNPELMDEKQRAAMQSQKMMLYGMPVMMVFIFRGLPSGLVLYWTIFNVFSIVQQYMIKNKLSN